jgi:sugar/nucleoside kinase (ribokinase family)
MAVLVMAHQADSGLKAGLVVVGNLSVDRIEGRDPSPGGCPTFVPSALRGVPVSARIIAKCAPSDRHLFSGVVAQSPCDFAVLDAQCTSGFGLSYEGDVRTVSVTEIGPQWSADEIGGLGIEELWIHLSPLLRSDFGLDFIPALAERGHRIALDVQGLVRDARLGPVEFNNRFDQSVFEFANVLKFSIEEAEATVGGSFDRTAARRLGADEILVTHGNGGTDLYLRGDFQHIPVAETVVDVDPTGAGDMFTARYVAERARGVEPDAAVQIAGQIVVDVLKGRALPNAETE